MLKHLKNLKSVVGKANAKSAIDRIIKIAESSDMAKTEAVIYEDLYNELADMLPAIFVGIEEDDLAPQVLAILGGSITNAEYLNSISDDYKDVQNGDSFLEAFEKAAGGSYSDRSVIEIIVKSMMMDESHV